MPEKRVTELKPLPKLPRYKNVGVYCRVSTGSQEQLRSLANQVSHFTQFIKNKPLWKLFDFYIDVASGISTEDRREFRRMLDDCHNGKIDVIITKSISRFGRNTQEALTALRSLKLSGVGVVFEAENIDTAETDSELMISLIEAFVQAENESRSANIRWGIRKRAADGTSGYYRRRCYGYRNNENGDLEVVPNEAETVRLVFELYLNGASLNMIRDELRRRGIPAPNGRDTWCRQSINMLLSNEKYTGDVLLMKSVSMGALGSKRVSNIGQADKYLNLSSHPPIIDKQIFEAVQKEKIKRSNVMEVDGVVKRREVRYTARK